MSNGIINNNITSVVPKSDNSISDFVINNNGCVHCRYYLFFFNYFLPIKDSQLF